MDVPGVSDLSSTAVSEHDTERKCPKCEHVYRGDAAELYCPNDGQVMWTMRTFEHELSEAHLLGQTLKQRFVINGLLGTGGYGAVYQAWDPNFRAQVAIKVLKKSGAMAEQSRLRFLHEARLLHRIQSPHVVRVTDLGTLEDGTQYMVMDWVRGRSMAELLNERPRPAIGRMLGLLDQVLAALEDVHAEGMVHRDLKPANIIVGPRAGDADWVTLIDFGIAKGRLGGAEANEPKTSTGAALGTPRYMAPEQFGNELPISERTDVYAAGVMLYEILAGRPPFGGSSFVEIGTGHLRDPIPPLPPDTPSALIELVHAAMEKHPLDRLPDARTMRSRLTAAGPFSAEPMRTVEFANRPSVSLVPGGLSTTAELSGAVGATPPLARSRASRWFAAVIVALLMGVGIWTMLRSPGPERSQLDEPERISVKTKARPEAATSPRPAGSSVVDTIAGAPVAGREPAQLVGEPSGDEASEVGPITKPELREAELAAPSGTAPGALDVAERPASPAVARQPEPHGATGRPQQPKPGLDPGQEPKAGAMPRPTHREQPAPRPQPTRQLKPAGPPKAQLPGAQSASVEQAVKVRRVRAALAQCRCDTAARHLASITSPPPELMSEVKACRIPDFDEVCRNGTIAPRQ